MQDSAPVSSVRALKFMDMENMCGPIVSTGVCFTPLWF